MSDPSSLPILKPVTVQRRAFGLIAFLCASLVLAGLVQAQELPVRDPTRPSIGQGSPAASTASVVERPLLEATIVSKDRRIALIDGRFYRVGERLNGREITRIEPGSIHLGRGSDEEQLRISTRPADGNDGDQGQ